MELIALKELRYAGKTILAGEAFEVTRDQDVRTLVAIKRAKQAPEKPKGEKAAKYKTRQMTAEGDGDE